MTEERGENLGPSRERELYGFRVDMDDSGAADVRRGVSRGIRSEYLYATVGLLLGTLVILTGSILMVNGTYGSVSWTARVLQAESRINDAGPGVVLALVGLFVVLVTRPNVVLRRPRRALFGVTRREMRERARAERKQWDQHNAQRDRPDKTV